MVLLNVVFYLVLISAQPVAEAATWMFSGSSDHVWNLVASIAGGVIGALAGGIPAYSLATRASRESTAKEVAARTDVDLAVLQGAFVKLLEITNGYLTVCSQINDMLYEAHVAGHKDMELWQKVKGLVGFEDGQTVRFASNEVALFLRNEDDGDFANSLLLLDRRYAAFLSSVKAYSDRRERLSEFLVPEKFVGGIGTVAMDQGQKAQFLPRAYAVNSIVEHILVAMHEDRRLATKLCDQFGWRAKRLFPKHRTPQFTGVDPVAR